MAENLPPVCSRLPTNLTEIIDMTAAQSGVSRAELIRGVLESYFFGNTEALVGVDEGYRQARRLAAQIAQHAIRQALEALPDTFEEAMSQLRFAQASRHG